MQGAGDAWGIILAGGDGTRVRDLTRGPNGASVPKQYCSFGGSQSLLSLALGRARRVVGPDRVVTVVAEQHRTWWEAELGRVPGGIPAENVIVQPRNRGTAIGVLLGLLQVVSRQGPLAQVLVLPSDHAVADEETLGRHLDRGLLATQQDPGRVVLLGMTPEGLDADYGWIVPSDAADGPARPVVEFLEKPDAASSQRLMDRGALLNTFIFTSRAATLLNLYRRVMPELLCKFLPLVSKPESWARDVLWRLYRSLRSRDFSREVLERCPESLSVVPVPPCGWSDLGTPARLRSFVEQRVRDARRRAPSAAPPGRPARPALAWP